MNRLLKLENLLLQVIAKQEEADLKAKADSPSEVIERDETLNWERIHMASSARLAWQMAMERGVEPELAACAAAVHDFGRILTGRQKGHAEAGYEPVRLFLKETGLFDEKETETIALAVKNHSSKTVVGTPLEEIVKDADVVDCYQYGYPFDRPEKEERYQRWQKERER